MLRTLTDADIEALTEALKTCHVQPCSLGFTPEEVSAVKRVIGMIEGAANLTGKIVLTAIVVILIGIFTKGFWLSLITGIKTAGGK